MSCTLGSLAIPFARRRAATAATLSQLSPLRGRSVEGYQTDWWSVRCLLRSWPLLRSALDFFHKLHEVRHTFAMSDNCPRAAYDASGHRGSHVVVGASSRSCSAG